MHKFNLEVIVLALSSLSDATQYILRPFSPLAKTSKRFQRPLFWYAFERKRCRDEKSRTAPKKGINTHAAFASGTTGICLSPLPLVSPLLSLSFIALVPCVSQCGKNESDGG